MRSPIAFLITVSLLMPMALLAATYEPARGGLYSDISGLDRASSIAVNALTEEGILQGDPSGTFRPHAHLNRAEFMKIVMGFLPEGEAVNTRCFPDVPADAWYALPVCRAKALGIVRGNVLEGIPEDRWQFKPTWNVNYAEAVKVLAEVFDLPYAETDVWYQGYLNAAIGADLDLPGLAPDSPLTRTEMARLAVAFLAHSRGELEALRRAERGEASSSSVSSSSSMSSSSSSVSSSSSSSSATSDTNGDTAIRSQFLLLGEVSPVVGAVDVFPDSEPLDVTEIAVHLTASAPSTVRAFLIYNGSGNLLGRALLDPSVSGNRTYALDLLPGTLIVPRRKSHVLYVRADIAARTAGGVSQTPITLSEVEVRGNGVWSTDEYTESESSGFLDFQTARAAITRISRAGSVTAPLSDGSDRTIGSFVFEGRTTDPGAALEITELVFTLSKSDNVILSNVRLGVQGFNEYMTCSVSTAAVTCSDISIIYGDLKNGLKQLNLLADISTTDTEDAYLNLSLGSPGTPTSPGAVTWTDGTGNFTWVGLPESTIAIGTRYER